LVSGATNNPSPQFRTSPSLALWGVGYEYDVFSVRTDTPSPSDHSSPCPNKPAFKDYP